MNVAIIGCGRIAQVRHIPQYATNKKACIVGFYDIVFERAKELADTYNAKAYKKAALPPFWAFYPLSTVTTVK